MTYELNSLKTFKDNGVLVICGMIIALFGMLLPMTWGASYQAQAESETETAGTMENEFPFAIETNSKHCEEEIKQELRNIVLGIQDEDGFVSLIWGHCECDYKQERIDRAYNQRTAEVREPGKLIEDELGLHQEMPPIEKDTPHERFKEMSLAYNLDPSTIWKAEDYYGLTEGMILCIAIAETSGGTKGAGHGNIGNVGNNDRGDRVSYAFLETALEKIGMTLTNKNLGRKQTLGCLSNAGNCIETYDNGKRYATSDGNRERNMTACLAKIYGRINPQTFNIRQR